MYDSDVGAREVNSRQEYFSVPKPCFFGERFYSAAIFKEFHPFRATKPPFQYKKAGKLLGTSWVKYTHLQKKKLISNLTREKKISLKTNSINSFCNLLFYIYKKKKKIYNRVKLRPLQAKKNVILAVILLLLLFCNSNTTIDYEAFRHPQTISHGR